MTRKQNLLPLIILLMLTFSNSYKVTGQQKQLLKGKYTGLESAWADKKDIPLNKIFKHHKLYKFDGILALKNTLKAERFSKVQLVFGDEYDWDLQLEEYDLKQNTYIRQVIGVNGIEESSGNSIITYRGFANGNQSHKTRITSINGQLSGIILQGEEEIYFEPAQKYLSSSDTNVYIVYKGSDVIPSANAMCGMAEAKETLNNLVEENIEYATAATGCVEVEIAMAADFSFVQQQGGVDAAEARMIEILNVVNGFYTPVPLEIEYIVVETFISNATASDPWSTTTDASTLLGSFRTWGNGGGFKKTFDVASLWTKRNIAANGNTGVVGVASLNAVCTSQKYNVMEHFSTNIKMVAIDQAHELGHNWSCQHVSGNTFIMNASLSTTTTQWDQTSINAINNWKGRQNCFTPCGPKAPVADFISDLTTTCNGIVSFTDQSLFSPTSYQWNFGDGTTSTVKNPTHTYKNNGVYNVSLTVKNALASDVEVRNNYITVSILSIPDVDDKVMCGAGSANLISSNSAEGSTLQWYSAAQGGESIYTGNSYSPYVQQTITYYVENSNIGPIQKVGPVDNTFSQGAFFNVNDLRGLVFDVLSPINLKSVKVYANGAGNRTIQVMDSVNGRQVISKTVNIPSGESRVALDFNLPSHKAYHLKVSGTVNLFRNTSNAKYPYVIPNVVSISETDVAVQNPGYYYYFYDWEVQKSGCATARVPVTVTVNCVTDIEDESEELSTKIFPNPVKEILTVECYGSNATLELSDILGTIVHTSSMQGVDNIHANINVSQLRKGIYFLSISQGNNKTVRKIVKD